MVSYTVVWLQEAEDELGRIWLDTNNRREIASAANALDDELRIDADMRGTHVREGLRTIRCHPLEIIFQVRIDDRLVRVLWVRQI